MCVPNMTGYEACRWLKKRRDQDIPIVFLSAKGQESEIRAKADGRGCAMHSHHSRQMSWSEKYAAC
jgi:CheY-like chemotaxis protein